jgi:hypothetical protein
MLLGIYIWMVAVGTDAFTDFVFCATAVMKVAISPNMIDVADRTAIIAKNQTTPFAKSEPVEHK